MCGIVGARDAWLRRRGLEPHAAMTAAVQRLRWRGPDGAGVVRIGGWWLGCARLAITQPKSRQPVVRRGGRFGAVLNGAVTNARELWAELLPRAERRAAPPNDAWLPLLAVAHGRRDLLAAMRGHHAYAVVDATTDELVVAQDRFGEKPLICCAERTGAGADRAVQAFASTPAALAAFSLPPPFRTRRAAAWFRFGFADPLPHRISARVRLERPPRTVLRPTDGGSPALRDRLAASVRRCTDTTVAAGLLLSGGVDSSCIAACLAESGRTGAPAYQFRAAGEPEDERAVARAVAARCGLSLRPVDGGPEVLDALPRLTELAGLPLGDPSLLAVHAAARAAAADGVRVLLGGEGADELLLGYRRYRALASLPRLPWLRWLAPRRSQRYAARWLRAATAPDPAAALLAVTPPAFGELALAPALSSRSAWRDTTPPHRAAAATDRVPLWASARAADLDGYLRHDLLPKVDVATMAAGVEARCPFLEGDFAVDGAARHALGKRPLRAAFANALPAAVMTQPKRGFALPLDRWFRGELPWLDLLAEPRSRTREHLRPGGLPHLVDLHRSGRADLGHGLYLLAAYELFLRARDRGFSASSGPE